MYRKCPEHPDIHALLINGEPNRPSRVLEKEIPDVETVELSETEFEDICFQRHQKSVRTTIFLLIK